MTGKKDSVASIAVFGSSEPLEGSSVYKQARRLGTLLAHAGYRVVTGGYGGVMEGASRGAREAAGTTVGVTCAVFDRQPNNYLSQAVHTADLFERTRELTRLSQGFVVLSGKSGTLAEVAFLWALHRAGCLDRKPVVLLGDPWRHLLHHLVRAGILEHPQSHITRVVDTPEEALKALAACLEG